MIVSSCKLAVPVFTYSCLEIGAEQTVPVFTYLGAEIGAREIGAGVHLFAFFIGNAAVL